ncbi:MAG: MCP four helix bundle domain-containing protein [Myxococcaceae bacterium]|nr:MCP four helix bundle domain-containing protein [Myxococcaceae bacterium]
MKPGPSIPSRVWAWSAGFLISIALVASAAGFILWAELRTDDQNGQRVADTLARAALISRIRLGAVGLESALEAHIRAGSDAQRQESAALIDQILEELRKARAAYVQLLPRSRADQAKTWERFERTSMELAAQVQEAARFSAGKDAEGARQRLVEQIQPRLAELDALATQLSRHNTEDAEHLQYHLERDKRRKLIWSGGVLAVALSLALAIGLVMSSMLRRQRRVIREQLAQLDAKNQELDAFAGRVAHDLVSPLAPLQGHLVRARRSPAVRADAAVTEHLQKAEAAAARMAGLVESLLRFCRAGHRGDPARTALDAVVTAQLLELAQSAAASGVELSRDLERGTFVDCPSPLLQCIVQNVLSNAVKYTAGSARAQVAIRVRREPGWGVIEVEDTGPGMDAATLAQLCRPFFRAPSVRELPGFGLGLATTRRLVDAHGGQLRIDSTPGVGTRVVVRLPAAAAPAVADEAADPAGALRTGGSPRATQT